MGSPEDDTYWNEKYDCYDEDCPCRDDDPEFVTCEDGDIIFVTMEDDGE